MLYSATDYDEKIIKKLHRSCLYEFCPNTNINEFLGKVIESLIQNKENNVSSHEGSSNHVSQNFETLYIEFHDVNPPGERSYIPSDKDLIVKKATVILKIKTTDPFYGQVE